jgi:adenylosuccinate lyase
VFSQAVLLALIESGLTRDQAYRMVQRHAMDAWAGKGHLRDLLAGDPALPIDERTLDSCFDTQHIVETSSVVFERLESLRL